MSLKTNLKWSLEASQCVTSMCYWFASAAEFIPKSFSFNYIEVRKFGLTYTQNQDLSVFADLFEAIKHASLGYT